MRVRAEPPNHWQSVWSAATGGGALTVGPATSAATKSMISFDETIVDPHCGVV
jgi:hypothetical protein